MYKNKGIIYKFTPNNIELVILNLFQDLLTIINREILNSDKFREPQPLTFQDDMFTLLT